MRVRKDNDFLVAQYTPMPAMAGLWLPMVVAGTEVALGKPMVDGLMTIYHSSGREATSWASLGTTHVILNINMRTLGQFKVHLLSSLSKCTSAMSVTDFVS